MLSVQTERDDAVIREPGGDRGRPTHMKTSRWSVPLLVAAALVAAGCGDSSDDAGPAGTPVPTVDDAGGDSSDDASDDAPDETVDGDWVLVSGHLDGEEIALVDGWAVTMSIDGDRIGGTAACNGYGGTVAVEDELGLGGPFVVGELSWTEMGCEPEVMELEQRFLAALGRVDSYELADTLSLAEAGVGTGLRFERVEPVADTELVGVTWRLDTLITGDTASNSSSMDLAFLEFHEDGTLTGSTSCRRLEGEWVLQGATVQIPTLSAIDDPTAGVCSPESEALDGAIIAVVESGMTVEIDGNRLTLTAPGGDGLSFVGESGSDEARLTGPTTDDLAGLDPTGGVDGLVAYGARPTDEGGEDALLEGELVVGDDGCLRVGDSVVLWPFGARWQPEPPAVLVDDLALVAGDRIAAGGGYHDVDSVGWWTENPEVTEYLRDCGASPGDGVFVIQHPVELLR